MIDSVDAPKTSRGLSRRDMIKGAAVAGAVAWTAPVIIDSLSSPAAAASACTIYWVKVTPSGVCFSACPGGGYDVSNAKWAGDCSNPSGCDAGDGSTHMPTVATSGDYLKIVLPSGSTFSSTTSFQIAGRYNGDGHGCPGNQFTTVTSTSCSTSSPPASGAGCWNANSDTGWIHRRYDLHSIDNGDPADICYFYLKFCSSIG